MLFTTITHKLKLHQIDLASLRCKSASEWAAAVASPDALAAGIARHLKRLIRVGLYFQLREVLQGYAVDRLVDFGNPAKHLTPTGIRYGSLHIHALVRIRCAPDRKLYWKGVTRGFHDDLGVLGIDGYFILAQLDTVAEQVRRRIPYVGLTT
ncbi:hypothetical protein D3C85_1457670 [compost metagenome]